MPVEDLGVVPDERHPMTKEDLLNDNVDLIRRAGSLLAARQPARAFELAVSPVSATQVSATATSRRITRLDVFLDGCPILSVDVQGGRRRSPLRRRPPPR